MVDEFLPQDNPFDIEGSIIPVSVRNPNISFKKLKDGPVHLVTVEIDEAIWNALKHANLTGHVAELEWTVTNTHGPSVLESAREPKTKKEPIGPYCRGLVRYCEDRDFWSFIEWRYGAGTLGTLMPDAKIIGDRVKSLLGVKSRREVDDDESAKQRYIDMINDYNEWRAHRAYP